MLRLGSALRVAARHGYRHASTGGVAGPGIVELREYVVNPQYIGDYMKASTEGGDLRKRLVPLRLFGTPETGDILNLAQHFYHYECLDERQAARNAAQADPEWQQYIATIRPHLLQQRSTILVEAPFIHDMIGLEGMAKETIVPDDEASGPGIYELRRYKVALGYDRLMEFMEHMEKGMHVKLAACDPGSKLCSVLNSDVGDICEVIEVWRHEDSRAMQQSRRNARDHRIWTHAVNAMGHLATSFRTSIVRPAAFSSWQ